MADSLSSPATVDPTMKQPDSDNRNRKSDPPATCTQPPSLINPNSNPNPIPNPNPTLAPASIPPPPFQSYAPPTQPMSYRPVPIPTGAQFSPVQNYQNSGVQPPGVGGVAGTVAPPMMQYPVVPGQLPNMALRPYAPMPNGYGAVTAPAPVS